MEPIIAGVREYIERHGLFKKGDRVLLSLSAGKDSIFLLHCILMLRGEMGFEAGIFHLNHMTRGCESDRDEEFLRRLGLEHGMETNLRRHDFSSDRVPGTSFEEQARNVRYRMLEEIADEKGYSVIATAHSRDDQIETVLMRIFTGTGIYGLQGIRPGRGRIVRPLLSVSAGDIYDYLRSHGIEWREDATNEDLAYTRNFIRHEILPPVRGRFPMAEESILSLSEAAGDTMSMLDGLISEKYGDIAAWREGALYIDADELKHSYPVFAHVVSSMIRRYFNHPVNRSMLREIHSKYTIGKANISLYADKGITAEKIFTGGKSSLVIRSAGTGKKDVPPWEYLIDLKKTGEQTLELAEIGISVTIKAADYAFFEKFRKNTGYIFVTMEKTGDSLYIRNRRNGDVIRTEKGTKKVKELCIEKKLDRVTKERVPLLVDGGTVMAFMTGLISDIPSRIAADFLVDKNSKKVIAVIRN